MILSLGIIIVLIAIGVWMLLQSNNSGSFTGIVQKDGCVQQSGRLPIGDVGCSITVNGKNIYIVHGNIRQLTWGTIEGFSTDQDITGKRVEVKAHYSGSSYDISGASDYVKLLN